MDVCRLFVNNSGIGVARSLKQASEVISVALREIEALDDDMFGDWKVVDSWSDSPPTDLTLEAIKAERLDNLWLSLAFGKPYDVSGEFGSLPGPDSVMDSFGRMQLVNGRSGYATNIGWHKIRNGLGFMLEFGSIPENLRSIFERIIDTFQPSMIEVCLDDTHVKLGKTSTVRLSTQDGQVQGNGPRLQHLMWRKDQPILGDSPACVLEEEFRGGTLFSLVDHRGRVTADGTLNGLAREATDFLRGRVVNEEDVRSQVGLKGARMVPEKGQFAGHGEKESYDFDGYDPAADQLVSFMAHPSPLDRHANLQLRNLIRQEATRQLRHSGGRRILWLLTDASALDEVGASLTEDQFDRIDMKAIVPAPLME